MLHVEQIKAARALLGWKQTDLADASGVGLATIQRVEAASGIIRSTTTTVLKLQNALENAGIVFLPVDQSQGIGVRLKKR